MATGTGRAAWKMADMASRSKPTISFKILASDSDAQMLEVAKRAREGEPSHDGVLEFM